MGKNLLPEHLTGIYTLDDKAKGLERQLWSGYDLLVDFSFVKPTSKDRAEQEVIRFLRKCASFQRVHIKIVMYIGPHPNNPKSYHVHALLKVIEEKSDDFKEYLARYIRYEWAERQGITRSGKYWGGNHPCVKSITMKQRVGGHTPYTNSRKSVDETGIYYRVKGHFDDLAYSRVICPRRKTACRKNKCKYQREEQH